MKYSIEEIGENSGEIWQIIDRNPGITLFAIMKLTHLKKEEVLLAIGWLFREVKIECYKEQISYCFKLKN